MTGSSLASWAIVAAFVERRTAVAVLGGMMCPLVVAAGSWLVTARAHRRNPERVTSVMMGAFAAKLVIVGAYVAAMLRVVLVEPVPFVAGFASYFIGLYAMEALFLRRLFADGAGASAG
jgi:hypothetical protein